MSLIDTVLDRAPATTDGDIKTHIVQRPYGKVDAQSWLTEARVFGLTVTAVCGYEWIPQSDPEKHPICETCVDMANMIISEMRN